MFGPDLSNNLPVNGREISIAAANTTKKKLAVLINPSDCAYTEIKEIILAYEKETSIPTDEIGMDFFSNKSLSENDFFTDGAAFS